jgi:hypothetical protein
MMVLVHFLSNDQETQTVQLRKNSRDEITDSPDATVTGNLIEMNDLKIVPLLDDIKGFTERKIRILSDVSARKAANEILKLCPDLKVRDSESRQRKCGKHLDYDFTDDRLQITLNLNFILKPKMAILIIWDPKGDGNCGYRGAAVILLGVESQYTTVKLKCLNVLMNWIKDKNEGKTTPFSSVPDDHLTVLVKKLLMINGKVTDQTFWYCDMDSSIILAEAFNRAVIYCSHEQVQLYLPYTKLPDANNTKWQPVILAKDRINHLYVVELSDTATPNMINWPSLGMPVS